MKLASAVALLGAAALTPCAIAIDTVSRSGRYLYNSTGRFYIKGVAYQQEGALGGDTSTALPTTFVDSLANGTGCTRDLPFLQQLGVNTIRAYSVDSALDHDSCMQTFSNAGIYAIIDLSLPVNGSIDSSDPAWTTNLLDLYLGTIDAFSKYDNILAFNIGNEVVTQVNETDAAPFVKAAARDIKAYLALKQSTSLVGYAAIDGVSDFRDPLANFLSCDPSGDNSGSTAIDLYGLNNYEWCGNSNFEAAYAETNGDFAGYNVPAYFSEFGCITSPPRLWTETQALFSSEMSDIWSGGLAFSYFPASVGGGQYGLVNISADGSTVTPNDDFNRLVTQYGMVAPPSNPSQSSAGSTAYLSCPQQNSTFLGSSTLPPTPSDADCQCLESSLSCQFTPTTSNTTAVIGTLLNTACSLLGSSESNCDAIATNGTTGSYGLVSSCDPSTKLSYVMTQYYESQGQQVQACSFAGNGTVNSKAPSSSSAVNAAANSCLSSATTTFTPSAPPTTATQAGSSSTTTGSSSSNGVVNLLHGNPLALSSLSSALTLTIVAGVWALAWA